ncbi:MAG: PEP-CTERM sorting domain-containing protein [Phycisphaerae bacterium]|nr:PEP-CTERM sorting domain-containing protein [Phycisphaerae bacterium]
MKKVAFVVMLLATSAFGGVLTVTAPTTVAADDAGIALVPLSVTSDTAIGAIGIYANADKANALTIISQTTPTGLNEKVTADPTSLGFIPGGPADDYGNFIGSYGLLAPAAAGVPGPSEPLVFTVLTVKVEPGMAPVVLNLIGDWASSASTGGLPGDLWPMQSVTITPEPASMILLAAGAAFFARRRRA